MIGAGIGGLTAAIALRCVGAEVTLYEQMPELTEVGSGITLWVNAMRVLQKLGVDDTVRDNGGVVDDLDSLTWDGKPRTPLPIRRLAERYGAPSVGIHRAVLQATLAGALDDGVLQLGAKCTGFELDGDGVRVRFENGREERADVLVGADGIRSTIHRQLRGEPQVRYSGYYCWRSSAHLEHPQLTAGRYVQLYATNSNFGIFPIGPDRWAWYGTQVGPSVAGQGADRERWKHEALDKFKDWWSPVSAVIEATPAAEMACHDISDRVPITGWTRGPVALLGDAAHPTTPTLGQGGCMAIEDALVLARSLEGEEDIASGLRRYEGQRVEHTSKMVRKAWRHGRIYHGINPALRTVRDLFILRAPERIAMREVDKLLGYEA